MPTLSYKCPNCGGETHFDPSSGTLKCGFCGSDFKMDDAQNFETISAKEQSVPVFEKDENPFFYSCPSCGAEIVTTETTAASFCHYCHAPVVLQGQLAGEWRPEMVIPFSISHDDAQRIFLDWCAKKRFTPSDFGSPAHLEKLSGVYYPCWVLDTEVDATLNATAKNIRTWRAGDTEFTETTTYRLERAGRVTLDDLTYTALSNEETELVQAVFPFEITKSSPFDMAYLSGFYAERRALEQKDVASSARADINTLSKTLLSNTTGGYGAVSVDHFSAQSVREGWSYTLLPVWVLTYNHRGKIYSFSLNGQTGKLFGALPVSRARLARLFFGVAAVLSAFCAFMGYML